jgi:serine/tyrosine/threonine adenylyltransferase
MTSPPILSIADFLADPVEAAHFPRHILRWRNDQAAKKIGLHALTDQAWIEHFGRFEPLSGNLPQPLALRYHGHQFGVYNPDIGDGRGFLFAQFAGDDGVVHDLSTKGSGQTPYSRFGDGRLTLKGAVRELLATELLVALGVDTSDTFSIIETGESLHRGDEPSPTRSAVLVRRMRGSVRIGSFQRLAAIDDADGMRRLLRYCLTHGFGQPAGALSDDEAAGALVQRAATQCAQTVAQQMIAGFVHGVLNTDNINITGESFDYGPWRFTPNWDPGFIAAYFDEGGRYAFGRQAPMVYWNVGQLAMSLRRIASSEVLTTALEAFAPAYEAEIARAFCWRLGVSQVDQEADRALVLAGERLMREGGVSIDQFFVDWHGGRVTENAAAQELVQPLRTALSGRAVMRTQWWEQAPPQSMHIEEVESIWAAIAEQDNWQPLYEKIAAVRAMGAALRIHNDPPKAPA